MTSGSVVNSLDKENNSKQFERITRIPVDSFRIPLKNLDRTIDLRWAIGNAAALPFLLRSERGAQTGENNDTKINNSKEPWFLSF